jgi:transcriptional regulator with XRE-family HTH domain
MPSDVSLPERFGRRVAALRQARNWSQNDLAERLAMSRTAVSHLEASMRDASERTVIVLAGVFRLEPHDLVDGTDYPPAKAERLPARVARYSEAELQCAIAIALADATGEAAVSVLDRLEAIQRSNIDPSERAMVSVALRGLTMHVQGASAR